MSKKEHYKTVAVSFIGGALAAVGALMMMGETGANSIKAMRQEDHAAYEEYRQQCEATLGRALTSLYEAERIVDGRR